MRRKNQRSCRAPFSVNRHPCYVRAWALIHRKHRTDIFTPAVLQYACFGRRALRFTFQFTPDCHAGSRFASRLKTRVVMPPRAAQRGPATSAQETSMKPSVLQRSRPAGVPRLKPRPRSRTAASVVRPKRRKRSAAVRCLVCCSLDASVSVAPRWKCEHLRFQASAFLGSAPRAYLIQI